MPRLLSLCLGLLCALGLSGAHAASYQFTGPTYGAGITNYVAPCPGGSCADYTAGMRTTGWFTYLGSLAPNLANHNLHADPNLMTYGFSDGLVSIESSHQATRLDRFQVSTDAGGNITSYWVVVGQWADGLAGPHAVPDRMHRIEVFSGSASTNNHNWVCGSVGATIPAGVADGCTSFGGNSGRSDAEHSNVGASWASGIPTLSISSVSANEGNAGVTNFNFTVSLDAAPTAPASVNWATVANTASEGVDYIGGSGTLNWAAGDGSSRTVTVQVLGDTTVETNETFRVRLATASGVGINDPHGTGTITNDDVAEHDLSLTKTDGVASTAPGATLAYTLAYANTGGQAASGVTLTETVPANTTFNAGASTAGWNCLPNTSAGATCTLSVGNLTAGSSGSTTFAVTVDSPLSEAITQISNTASIADDGSHGPDPTPANNSASDTDTVVHPQVPPVMGNVPDQTATVGVAFSLQVSAFATSTNGDPITSYDVASGALPPGLMLNPGTGAISGTPTTAGAYQITVTANDDDGSSNADTIQFTVAASPVVNVPTLSEWALMVLAGLLGVVAWTTQRKGRLAPTSSQG